MNITGYTIENQNSLRRPVALKVMNPLLATSAEFSERFLNEGRLLAALQHNHIMTIYDIGICDGLHYISMELVDGGDLKQRISSGIAPQTALDYVIAIGSCLQAAHEANIVHRDVKPVNILFRRNGTLLLTDFGIAKQLVNPEHLTTTGNLMGTPYYLSPEQALGNPIDGRADIYSLGVVLYEMLVRQKPFEGRSEFDIVLKQVEEPLPRLPQNLAHFQSLLDKMTAKQPDERFSDAASLLHAAQHLRDSGRWDGGNIISPVSKIAAEPGAINSVHPQEADDGDAPVSAQTVVNQTPDGMAAQTVRLDKQRQAPDASSQTTPKRRKIGKLAATVGVLGVVTVVGVLAFAFVIITIALPGPDEHKQSTPSRDSQQEASDHQATSNSEAELAKQAELEKQAALEKQAELARQAELEKQAELQRQTELARQAALEKQAELHIQTELATQQA
jgi:serine/threonine-protein kinase PpkA